MVDIAYGEPESIRAGDTLQWKRSLSDYPPATWTLVYSLLSASTKVTITGAESGSDHLIDEDAATTAAYTAGNYDWTAHVTDGTDRHTIAHGTIEILPDLSAAATYDNRTHARIMLDAIEAVLESRATNDQIDIISTSIGSRALGRDKSALMEAHSKYKALVKAEDQAEEIRNGSGTGRMVRVRFVA